MPIVEVDGQEIEFPDSMSRDEIKSVLQKKFSAPQTKQQGTAGGAGRAFAYGFSGGQIPFGNVITSGIGAGIAKVASPFTGDERTFGQLYDQAQMDTKATQEANPNATLAGNIAGIVSTLPVAFSKPVQGAGIIATPAKGLQNLGNFTGKMVSATPFKGSGMLAGAGNLGTRMVGGAAVSAPVGGLYAAGEADAGNRMEALGEGARTGAYLGAAFPVAGALVGSSLKGVSNAYKGITARGEVALEDAFQGIKDASSKLYKATEQAGVLAKPDAAKTLIDDLSGIIKTKDIASQRLYSHTLRSIKDLEDDVLSGNTGLMTLDRHRQILGNISKDITNPNKAQEAEAAGRAIDVIDDFVDNLTPDKLINGTTEAVESLVNARSLWAKSKRFEKIASFVNNAGNDANKFKRDLEKFRLNPKNTLGWSDAEKEALKAASSQTTGEGVLKALGKFGFDIGSGRAPGNTVGAVIGSAVAGTASGALAPAALVPIVGTAARTTHKLITFGKAEELLKVIEQGGKVTNQMVAKLPKSEQKKFLSEVMQMPVAKAQAIFGEKIKPAMQKSKQFAKDYIADESGALTIGGKKFYRGVSGDFPDKEFTFWTPSKKEAESYASGSALTNNGTNKVILERIFEGGKGKNIDEEILETIMDGFEYNGKIIDDPDEVAKIIMDREGLDWVEFMHPSADGGEDHIVRVVRKNLSTDGNSIHEWGYNADESGALKLFNNNDTTKLYRGLTKEYDPSYNLSSTDAPLGYSTWTDNPELAKQYAGKSGFVYEIELPNNKKGIEMIDKNGERFLFLNNQKKAGLNKISGDEYLIYNYHDDFSPNLIKKYENK